MMPITASSPIQGAHVCAASGRMGSAMRMNPYAPSFRRIAASRTEPTVGASVCASGSHVWNGNIGTLIANPRKSPANSSTCVLWTIPAPWRFESTTMSKVCTFDRKNRARNDSSIIAEPNSVNRKNLIDAYSRFGPPHTPIMKNIGSRTISKKMKKRIRSCATNVPFIPTSSRSTSARKAFGLCGSGKWFHE